MTRDTMRPAFATDSMTLVRVVDYVASPGGGCRFTAQMLRALRRVTSARFEIVTYAHGTRTYRALLGKEFAVRGVAPKNTLRAYPPWTTLPGGGALNRVLGLPEFHFEVPGSVFEGCDTVWLPWVQRHRIPWHLSDRVVGTLHDLTNVEVPGVVPERWRENEVATLREWLRSSARLLVSSDATVDIIARRFGPTVAHASVVPLSSQHERPPRSDGVRRYPFGKQPYLLCPSNVSPHKNLDVLLRALASWSARVPLVITGSGTDLWRHAGPRQSELRDLAESSGLVRDRDVFGLGYVDDADYYAILDGAWALVMPTLAEGGGSFPVLEAMEAGIPVLASDIPVMREMGRRWNANPIWFNPHDPSDLRDKLAALHGGYERHRAEAAAQVPNLTRRSWEQVAREYARVMGLDANQDGPARQRDHA